jgi:hypothetical protein
MRWDLTEIAIYLEQFSRPHESTADSDAAWDNLVYYLAPEQRWSTWLR